MSKPEYSKYHQAITEEMHELAKIDKSLFLGQQCLVDSFYGLLDLVPLHQRREFPVCEELQLGMSLGLSLEGFLPISIFQRCDFIPRAFDQLVNHLELCSINTRRRFNPKIIIFTTIGSIKPLNVGLQHSQDLTDLFKEAVTFPVLKLDNEHDVKEAFNLARNTKESIMIIAKQSLFYND